MKFKLRICLLVLASFNALADDVFRIEVGKDYQSYSNSELQRRVWELERAVFQMQQRMFQLEVDKPLKSWICTIKAMNNPYTGTGATKAVAKSKAIENCKAGQKGDGFFCNDPVCEQ